LKIAHVTHSLDPAAGGLPVVPIRLASAQASLGHDVTLLAQRDSAAQPGTPILFEGVPGIAAVRHEWLPPSSRWTILGGRPIWVALERLLRETDILHLHGIWAPVICATAKFAASRPLPYVVAPHGMLDPWSLAQKPWKKRLALALVWRGILNRAVFVHCLNRDEERLLADLRLSSPTEVIPNGIFIEEIVPRPGSFAQSRPELRGRQYILFLGRLHPKKGLDILADAFRILASIRCDIDLVVAGPDGGARGDLEDRLAYVGLTDRVHLVDSLHGREKWTALRDATCFCLPSRQEGFSVAILEALASRTPVVVSDACHFPEVAAVGAGEIVPLDATALAAALERVIGDPSARRRMGDAGRQLVEDRFTWGRAAETSIADYERAAGKR
jgi:glycosyltransferase involved in cell wall biosynthesis